MAKRSIFEFGGRSWSGEKYISLANSKLQKQPVDMGNKHGFRGS